MIPALEFELDLYNNVIIKDTTVYDDDSHSGRSFHTFKKLDSGSVFVLGYHHKDNLIEYIAPYFVNCHTDESKYKISIPKDGWITLYHIILPTKEYIDSFTKEEMEGITYGYYICDGNIYDRNHLDNQGCHKKVDLEEIIEGNSSISTSIIYEKDFITIYNLQTCLVNLCKLIFDSLGAFGECFNSKVNKSDLIYKRDIVWMAINVIKYLSKFNMKAEAARIIDQLEGCNGICTLTSKSQSVSGCGCNK